MENDVGRIRRISRKAFLSETKTGLILRVYANREEDVQKRIEMIRNAITATRRMTVEGMQFVRRIDVMVWADNNYKDSDCGKTAPALRDAFKEEKGIFIHEIKEGDIFCSILNDGIYNQVRNGNDYSIVASAEAFSYMTPETAGDMIDAACKGAKAIPVAIAELTQSILEGRGANTFMMWHNKSLTKVGLFDLSAEKPIDDRMAHFMKGWSAEKGDVYYHKAGVEEMIPLARMVGRFGPCIAPIVPSGEGVKAYVMPDPVSQPEEYDRQLSKFGTKWERQFAQLASIGFDPSHLKGGVMAEYRQF